MYYLIGRDLDADGRYEFVKDMENMILTEDANSAIQMTETQLSYLDMEYLNAAGFYALEADRFQVSILEKLLFSPLVMGYRPRVAPPPRRHRRMPPPPPPRPRRRPVHRPHSVTAAVGILNAMLDHHPVKPSRHGPKPRPRPAAPARRTAPAPAPARPGAGRRSGPGAGRSMPAPARKPGGRGPGGRGPGR